MARNLSRLFSSAIELSTPKLALSPARSGLLSLSDSDSLKRFISSSTHHHHQQQQQQETNPNKPEPEASEKLQNEEKEEDDGDELDINEATGEIGGPRGPEPTRYGDWEKNGRCYDF